MLRGSKTPLSLDPPACGAPILTVAVQGGASHRTRAVMLAFGGGGGGLVEPTSSWKRQKTSLWASWSCVQIQCALELMPSSPPLCTWFQMLLQPLHESSGP